MNIRFDPEKDGINLQKHGISLDHAHRFDFAAAKFTIDDSQDYGELRFMAIGFLAANLYVVILYGRE